MAKRFIVRLTAAERATLTELVETEERVARKKRKRAAILLKADQGKHGPAWIDTEIAAAFNVHVTTVRAVRRQLVLEGLESTLNRKPRAKPPRTPVFDATNEGELLAVATGEPPSGHARWTLRLLADRLVELRVVESVSHETVRKALKKTTSSRTVRSRG